MIIWITGAPGSGKTTLANQLSRVFGRAVVLDGDDVRQWLTPDCDFSDVGRLKHAERVYEVAAHISSVGGVAICALVAHPPKKVDLLIGKEGNRRPLWEGTHYALPENADVVFA